LLLTLDYRAWEWISESRSQVSPAPEARKVELMTEHPGSADYPGNRYVGYVSTRHMGGHALARAGVVRSQQRRIARRRR
jgi:hypothetical protein